LEQRGDRCPADDHGAACQLRGATRLRGEVKGGYGRGGYPCRPGLRGSGTRTGDESVRRDVEA